MKRKAKAKRTRPMKRRQPRARRPPKRAAPAKRVAKRAAAKKRAAPSPSSKSLAEKLFVRAGSAIAVLNCPKPPDAILGPMPQNTSVQLTLDNPAELILLFVRNSEELGQHVQAIASKLSPEVSLWVAYPKQGSEIETDLTRDVGWDLMNQLGWGVVSLVSVDDTWTAMRFKQGLSHTAAI